MAVQTLTTYTKNLTLQTNFKLKKYMINKTNFLEFLTIKNGIVKAYDKLINSDNLSQDLLKNTENFECYLVNNFINIKLKSDTKIPQDSNYSYSLATANNLVNDPIYCEKWLEIVKSYLFCIGVDVEKNDEPSKINMENLEKTKDRFKVVSASIKFVAQLALQNKNLGLYDQVFDIYCSLYESFASNYSEFVEHCLFSIEESFQSNNELVRNYKDFCFKYTDKPNCGVFSDLEGQINEDLLNNRNYLDNKSLNQINDEDEYNELIEEEEFSFNDHLEIIKNNLLQNQETDLSNLPTVFENSIIVDNFNDFLVEAQVTSEFKNNFLKIVELFAYKIGIDLKNKSGLPVSSFLIKEDLSNIISSIKLLACISQDIDQKFFSDLSNYYHVLYEKFSQIGLLDNEDGFSECFYGNEIANSEAANFYQKKSPDGVFIEIENKIDKQRYDILIEQNIKKFDEKTVKFYQAPFIDIRLQENNQSDYQIEIIFDGSKISFESVAKEFGQNPSTLKDWQKKITNEGYSISFSHDTVANYFGIKRGEELNQTLLAIRDQALEEKELLKKTEVKESEIDDFIFENEEFEEDVVKKDLTDSFQITSSNSITEKFDYDQDLDLDQDPQDNSGVKRMFEFYENNINKIEDNLTDKSLKNLLNFIVLNPDIKIEVTSNPLSNEQRLQLKLVFRNGYNEKAIQIISQFVTGGRRNNWQFSQNEDAISRGYEGAFTIPHSNSANILGAKNTKEANEAITKAFDLVSNLELLSMVIIDLVHKDNAYNYLVELVRNDFAIAFEYQEYDNIFSTKNLVFVAQNKEERERIYNFLGYGFEQNPNISRQDMENFRAKITDQNGDIIANTKICQALYEVTTDQEVDVINRKMESFLQANKILCDSFNADEHLNLITLLNLNQVNKDQDNEEVEDYSDEEEFESLYA
ncbi:hypothetical protein LBMAG18_05460 [Alphaproteobacteria bacterium]|nr:hypothetical protein LBMAG18_05460 [Alphaproteobacteria bacterium]